MAYMKEVVFPRMKARFQAFDAKRFSGMSCATCHGEGAANGTYSMPNPQLPRLWPTGNFAVHQAADPLTTKFMMETVKPEMAKLLGMPLYEKKTGKGFGCLHCHVQAKQ